MKFSRLSPEIQLCIASNIFDVDKDSVLSTEQLHKLNAMNPGQLFQSWCTWNGFIGWADTIHSAHKEIFSK